MCEGFLQWKSHCILFWFFLTFSSVNTTAKSILMLTKRQCWLCWLTMCVNKPVKQLCQWACWSIKTDLFLFQATLQPWQVRDTRDVLVCLDLVGRQPHTGQHDKGRAVNLTSAISVINTVSSWGHCLLLSPAAAPLHLPAVRLHLLEKSMSGSHRQATLKP